MIFVVARASADGADDEMQAALLRGEDVLDLGADLRPSGVAATDVRRHRLAPWLGALKLRCQPTPLQ